MTGAIRYCTTEDGVRLAYSVEGDGPVLILCGPTWATFAHNIPETQAIEARLMDGRCTVRYDPRGVGLSTRDPKAFTHDLMVRDLETVIRATGFRSFAFYAAQFSVAWAIEYAARHPEQVERLVLSGGWARPTDIMPRKDLDALVGLIRSNWVWASQMLTDQGSRDVSAERAHKFAEQVRQDISAAACAQWLIDLYESTDVVALLPAIEAPALILHRTGDRLVAFAGAQDMAAQMRNARLMALPGEDPPEWGDDGPRNVQAIVDFLDEGRAPDERRSVPTRRPESGAAGAPGTAVILFADIADSTALTEHLGDAAFRERARALDTSLRTIITGAGGAAIDGFLAGDGVLATFPAASQAIDAALRCGGAGSHAGLPLHLGLHAGDVIRESNNVFGGAVNIASRISGLSAPGEVLVSDIVRGLARTSAGVTFEDRGEHALKGIAEPQRVYVVRASD